MFENHMKFTDADFKAFSDVICKRYGICFNDNKRELLQQKLLKIINRTEVNDFRELFDKINKTRDHEFEKFFLDEITTHKTDYFREKEHFDYLNKNYRLLLDNNPDIAQNGEVRVWSSACSTGEEPYTLAMVLRETLPSSINVRVLATDISEKVLKQAQDGIYRSDIVNDTGKYYVQKYFIKQGDNYVVNERLRDMVTFRRFNLMDDFRFRHDFHIIFCRNVMIYFDKDVQSRLVKKFHEALAPSGLFFIGLSETIPDKNIQFKTLQSSTFLKCKSPLLNIKPIDKS